jgi:hypothetical protein
VARFEKDAPEIDKSHVLQGGNRFRPLQKLREFDTIALAPSVEFPQAAQAELRRLREA